jgi:hypothetical protein
MELWVRFRDGRAPDPQALAAIVDFLPRWSSTSARPHPRRSS